jgi:16S rRNA (uracil1498-N3)-methyltransferase
MLDREQTYHARKVLRLGVGQSVDLFNGRGLEAVGQITGSGTEACFIVDVFEATFTDPPRPRIDLAVSLPKGPRCEQLIEQASQLGADRLIPLRTERSIVEPREAKMQRLQKIAIESAKQCQRPWVMQVEPTTAYEPLLEESYDVGLLAMPGGNTAESLAQMLADASSVLILIGPEGGFTDLEVHIALTAGCVRWTISPHILRIETAAAVAIGVTRYLANL